ncbi:MAG TPA: alpha/beta hydrolase [Vicinamibacterales bacterium]|nr:alpha/beta hydrolase [Vicinamibacterales bacterium]
MPNLRRLALRSSAVLIVIALIAFGWKTRVEGHKMITNPRETRKVATVTPASKELDFEDARVTTSDGLRLNGWFIPGSSADTVMIVHGYKDQPGAVLGVADVLHRHGYSSLVVGLRGHDVNDGDTISFGLYEVRDLAAWYDYLHQRQDVDQAHIGLFGVSMGGSIGLRYASQNSTIRAVIADSAFSSVSDTAATSIRFFTGLPAFPFAPAIVFWAERELGGSVSGLDATTWIRTIAPRPVFLMQGGADTVVSVTSGQRLYEAAGDPKEFWYEPTVKHAQFLKMMPEAFETRVTGFLDRYLR